MFNKFRNGLRVAACCLVLSGCGNTKIIRGIEYNTYGLANQSDRQNPDIEYELSLGSVFWAVIFSETIIVPLYVILYDLYQPVGPKYPSGIKGEVTR